MYKLTLLDLAYYINVQPIVPWEGETENKDKGVKGIREIREEARVLSSGGEGGKEGRFSG